MSESEQQTRNEPDTEVTRQMEDAEAESGTDVVSGDDQADE